MEYKFPPSGHAEFHAFEKVSALAKNFGHPGRRRHPVLIHRHAAIDGYCSIINRPAIGGLYPYFPGVNFVDGNGGEAAGDGNDKFLKEDGRVVERSSSIGIAVILLSFGGEFLTGY